MRTPAIIIVILVLLIGCKPEKVEEVYEYRYAHEEYLGMLERAGLDKTALGRDWKKLSIQSLSNPVNISFPYQENFFLDSAVPGSNGYRFLAKRGHRVEIDVEFESRDSAIVFMDLFRETKDEMVSWDPVASADKTSYNLAFEPRKDNFYVLRLQPELLRGGEFNIRIIAKPVLKFPVKGGHRSDIGSYFNDPRDGGRRKHHGIDIFARRYTPVIAPSRSRVRRTGESQIGGKHVWLYDSLRNAHYYFAHLQAITASEDNWVEPGDTIGSVGNTGNARTTPPHLHFGIYVRNEGPVDPIVYVLNTDTTPELINPSLFDLNETALLEQEPLFSYYITNNGPHDSLLTSNTQVKILGKSGDKLRVKLNNSITGFIEVPEQYFSR